MPEPSDKPETAVAPDAAASPGTVNPKLSASLRADYEALRNDVQQANEMAAHFQMQLAGKSNEFALLKQVFEKTCEDLIHLQTGITALREERHRLANEAMRATALEAKLANVTGERDRLRIELQVIRDILANVADETARASRQRDFEIAELSVRVMVLKQALSEAEQKAAAARESKAPAAARNPKAEIALDADPDFIDISFGD
jgi:chromosome segregation ATPase